MNDTPWLIKQISKNIRTLTPDPAEQQRILAEAVKAAQRDARTRRGKKNG